MVFANLGLDLGQGGVGFQSQSRAHLAYPRVATTEQEIVQPLGPAKILTVPDPGEDLQTLFPQDTAPTLSGPVGIDVVLLV